MQIFSVELYPWIPLMKQLLRKLYKLEEMCDSRWWWWKPKSSDHGSCLPLLCLVTDTSLSLVDCHWDNRPVCSQLLSRRPKGNDVARTRTQDVNQWKPCRITTWQWRVVHSRWRNPDSKLCRCDQGEAAHIGGSPHKGWLSDRNCPNKTCKNATLDAVFQS